MLQNILEVGRVGGSIDETELTLSWQLLKLSDRYMGLHYTSFYSFELSWNFPQLKMGIDKSFENLILWKRQILLYVILAIVSFILVLIICFNIFTGV